ncbi:MAG: DUF6766 family protein [Flavisolibacter sp.]
MKKLIKNNSLSIVFFVFFILTMIAQVANGIKVYNKEQVEEGGKQVSLSQYLGTGHFIEATFENWESEFLQMALFVWLSMFLYQKGSSESKDPDNDEEVDREPDKRKKDAPWPVKKGGFILGIYKNSLSYSLFLLFLFSFCMHWYGSMKEFNEQQLQKGQATETAMEYLGNAKLWFESFENWQSEFLSVFSIVVLSIFLRQKGSAQSSPVDAPDSETG